jgi:hypothetical protein
VPVTRFSRSDPVRWVRRCGGLVAPDWACIRGSRSAWIRYACRRQRYALQVGLFRRQLEKRPSRARNHRRNQSSCWELKPCHLGLITLLCLLRSPARRDIVPDYRLRSATRKVAVFANRRHLRSDRHTGASAARLGMAGDDGGFTARTFGRRVTRDKERGVTAFFGGRVPVRRARCTAR